MSQESQFSEDLTWNWVQWFCSLDDHQFLCEINHHYIKQPFNLYGLNKNFTNFNAAYQMILNPYPLSEKQLQKPQIMHVYQEATQLYGLIHARYIGSPEGLAIMREKYLIGKFGHCPRVLCEKQNVIPIGISESSKIARVKVYCPRCKDIYSPSKKYTDIDGSFFGTSFPHLLLMTYPDLKAEFPKKFYEPTVFGFKYEGSEGNIKAEKQKYQEEKQTNVSKRKQGKSEIGTSTETKSHKNKKKK